MLIYLWYVSIYIIHISRKSYSKAYNRKTSSRAKQQKMGKLQQSKTAESTLI